MEQLENFNKSYTPNTGQWAKREAATAESAIEQSIFYDQMRQLGATTLFITIERKSQERHAIPARDIDEMYFHPDKGIYLFFRTGQLHIQGRNLQPLAIALTQQRVTTIRDYCRKADMLFDQKILVITKITYESEYLARL